jgi:putative ABC transport system permease protein
MNLLESLRVALRGLSSNKMRTALTMLGIIIGVGVVIIVVAIGQGASQRVADTINALGTNLLTVQNGPPRVRLTAAVRSTSSTNATGTSSSSSSSSSSAAPNRLMLQDAKNIAENFSQAVEAVAPNVGGRGGNVQIRLGDTTATTSITGCDLEYPYVNNYSVARGSFFTQSEIDGTQKVCVCGVTIADKLTGNPDADLTGREISINRLQFKVLGMLTPKGSGAWGQDQDDVILMPITTAMRRVMNRTNIDSISVRCTSQAMMPLAQEQIANYLRNRHRLQPPFPDNDDFWIRNNTEVLASQQDVTATMTSLLSAVAIISLVVGGIGIMNIMLVSVTERTREIGIRKAIGATPRDILLQFLIESAIISLLGGIIGIGLGVGGAQLLASLGGWNTESTRRPRRRLSIPSTRSGSNEFKGTGTTGGRWRDAVPAGRHADRPLLCALLSQLPALLCRPVDLCRGHLDADGGAELARLATDEVGNLAGYCEWRECVAVCALRDLGRTTGRSLFPPCHPGLDTVARDASRVRPRMACRASPVAISASALACRGHRGARRRRERHQHAGATGVCHGYGGRPQGPRERDRAQLATLQSGTRAWPDAGGPGVGSYGGRRLLLSQRPEFHSGYHLALDDATADICSGERAGSDRGGVALYPAESRRASDYPSHRRE